MHLKQKNKAVSTSSHLKLIFLRKTNFFKNLYLKTPQTLIKDEPYRLSIAAISDTVEELSINTTLKESSLDLKTFCFFVPGLANTLPFKNKCYKLNGRIFGKLNEIQIPSIAISIGKTTMVGSGSITGLPDTDKAYFDFDIELCQRQRTSMTFCPKKLSRIELAIV
jgi:hypothetical protein